MQNVRLILSFEPGQRLSLINVFAVSFSAVRYTPISTSFLNFLPVQLQRMKLEDFIRNLRGIDNNRDLDEEMLTGIYERIRNQEFRPGTFV